MTEVLLPPWSFEAVAESFRAELRAHEVRTFLDLLAVGLPREPLSVRASLPDRLRVALEYLP